MIDDQELTRLRNQAITKELQFINDFTRLNNIREKKIKNLDSEERKAINAINYQEKIDIARRKALAGKSAIKEETTDLYEQKRKSRIEQYEIEKEKIYNDCMVKAPLFIFDEKIYQDETSYMVFYGCHVWDMLSYQFDQLYQHLDKMFNKTNCYSRDNSEVYDDLIDIFDISFGYPHYSIKHSSKTVRSSLIQLKDVSEYFDYFAIKNDIHDEIESFLNNEMIDFYGMNIELIKKTPSKFDFDACRKNIQESVQKYLFALRNLLNDCQPLTLLSKLNIDLNDDDKYSRLENEVEDSLSALLNEDDDFDVELVSLLK